MSLYDPLIQRAVAQYLPGIDWRLYKAQLLQESQLQSHAVSPVGARGIAQFMPATWAEWAPRAGYDGFEPEDPEAAIITGAAYMAHLRASWYSPRPEMDRHCLAMASYNAGLGNIVKAQTRSGGRLLYREIVDHLFHITGHNSSETLIYVKEILRHYARYITG